MREAWRGYIGLIVLIQSPCIKPEQSPLLNGGASFVIDNHLTVLHFAHSEGLQASSLEIDNKKPGVFTAGPIGVNIPGSICWGERVDLSRQTVCVIDRGKLVLRYKEDGPAALELG